MTKNHRNNSSGSGNNVPNPSPGNYSNSPYYTNDGNPTTEAQRKAREKEIYEQWVKAGRYSRVGGADRASGSGGRRG